MSLFNNKLSKVPLGMLDQDVQDKFTGYDTSLAEIANHTPNAESVIFYNADPTKTNDSTQAFINAMQNYEIVLVPTGDFKFNSAITIQSAYKVRKIIGIGRDSSRFYFSGTDGIINNKSGVVIEGIGMWGSNNTGSNSGLRMNAPIQMKNCQIYTFDIGIDLTNPYHIVSAFFEKTICAYNKSYGVKIVSSGNNNNNAITFKEMYIVKNGLDADTLTSNATIGSGDGMYINGGYAILIQDCVFEYNTGVGLNLTSANYPLYGVSVVSPYFERNKYAQLYIDNSFTSNYITGLTIIGDFYSDAGYTPVSNALSNRQMYVTKPNKLLNNQTSNNMGQYSFSERNIKTRRSNMLNTFPVNSMSDLSVDYPNNITTYNSESVFQITGTIAGQTLYSELMYIDPIYDYVFSYDITKVNTSASPNLLSYLYDDISGSLIKSASTYLGGSSFGWTTQYFKITGLSATQRLRLYLNIEGTKPLDLQVYVKNIRLIPILKNPLYNGFNVAVAQSATTLVVSFATAEADTNYAISVTPSWNTSYWTTNKTTTGFTINFGTAPASASTLDWSIKR